LLELSAKADYNEETGNSQIKEKEMPSPEEKYRQLYQEMCSLCTEQGWGDPFSYARSKEIYAATKLGHSIAETFSGADAFNAQGEPVEYKSTISDKIKATYSGISVFPTWAEQENYLREEKIAKYPEHFLNRFDNGELVESWKLTGEQVFNILLPKLKKAYPNVLNRKDPRLSAMLNTTEIKNNGVRVV